MIFYKICDHKHPTSKLPSVLWDSGAGKAFFEFTKSGIKGVLACETENPEIIDMLTEAGYITEHNQSGNLNRMGMAGAVPEGTELPQPKLTQETKNAIRRFTK
jgi:hypothetical protein